MNKNKIVNDPVWGFVTIPTEFIYELISHPYFQRMRRISQMGLSYMVYPGAVHTRFHHSLGCMHLMRQALVILQSKGVSINEEEKESACLAVLLHDIGHGPFSHVLERIVLPEYSHEELSKLFISELNNQYSGKLEMAISIFNNQYHKKFLHQLISGQLDVDRLDYLNRDSFYTGVQEGTVGTERILEMMNISNGMLVVEEKGIYSLEKFVLSRRMMYWQVYMHKTSVCAEQMLIHCVERARTLILQGNTNIGGSPFLLKLMKMSIVKKDIRNLLSAFADIDDSDIWMSLKSWRKSEDEVLRKLSSNLLTRSLFNVEVQNKPFSKEYMSRIEKDVVASIEDADLLPYFCYQKELNPRTYDPKENGISILRKDGRVVDITTISELLDRHFVMKTDTKQLLCYL